MNFENDPIAKKVDKIMIPLKELAGLSGGHQYNRVWEAFYEILKEHNGQDKQTLVIAGGRNVGRTALLALLMDEFPDLKVIEVPQEQNQVKITDTMVKTQDSTRLIESKRVEAKLEKHSQRKNMEYRSRHLNKRGRI